MISIIGGGIGGLTLALAFEKLGVEYNLYERAETLTEVGAGIWIPPNALQVIQWIDQKLFDRIKEQGNTIDRITVGDSKLNPISDTYQDFVKNEFGFSTITIHRGKLQAILYEFANKEKIKLSKSFKEFKQIEDNHIEVVFEDKSSVRTQYLIAADGINSKVRTQLFPESRLRYSGQTCWRGVAAYKIDPSFDHRGVEMWGEQLRFGISRLEEGKVYWFAVALSEPNQQDDRSILKKKLHDMFIDFHPEALNLIQNTPIEKIIRTDLSELQILDTWYQDNICLIGDAAHSMTPDLGQGGGQAIEDAFYLSNMISKNKEIAKVFAEFYQLRHQKVNQIVKKSWGTGIIANIKYGKRIRNFLFRSIPDKLLKKQMIKMYRIDKTITNV